MLVGKHRLIAVSGVNGFVGHHLVRELVAAGHRVLGLGREAEPTPDIDPLLEEYFAVDLARTFPDIGSVDALVHLAGLAAVGPSFGKPQEYITANSSMVTNVCEALLDTYSEARVIVVSSGALYCGEQPLPITEESPLKFSSPYAVSKALIEHQAAYYVTRGLDCVVARPFNHIGPGQGTGFLVPDLAGAIRGRASEEDPIVAGDLTSRRDYTDVRDVARAYRLLIDSDTLRYRTYNVCSGHSVSGAKILGFLTDAFGIPPVDTTIEEKLLRPNDVAEIIGSNRRLFADTGWSPVIGIDRTVADFVAGLT